jgi:hypothetical protein
MESKIEVSSREENERQIGEKLARIEEFRTEGILTNDQADEARLKAFTEHGYI